jgi:hypothetical protein
VNMCHSFIHFNRLPHFVAYAGIEPTARHFEGVICFQGHLEPSVRLYGIHLYTGCCGISMDIGLALERAYNKLVDLIQSFQDFYDNNPDFLPLKDDTWNELPTPTQLKNQAKKFSTNEGRMEYFDNFKNLYLIYFEECVYASTSASFIYAYTHFSGTPVVSQDLLTIKAKGGHIIPLDPSVRNNPKPPYHPVFSNFLWGVRYYPIGSDFQVPRAGVSTGVYEDKSRMETIFYNPSNKPRTGPNDLVNFRFLEFLSDELFPNQDSGVIFQLVVKLKKDKLKLKIQNKSKEVNEEYATSMMTAYCEVLTPSRWWNEPITETKRIYGHEMLYPLLAKPLAIEEIQTKINMTLALVNHKDGVDPYKVRSRTLTSEEITKWNYKAIEGNKKKRKLLWDCILNYGIKCGHHKDDSTTPCRGINKPSDLHIGHILSQHWANSYNIFQESVHHPDNLFLTCKSCNSSLNFGCPSRAVLQYINDENLTVGDLIRTNRLD